MASASAIHSFMILGHGQEDVVNFNARETMPEGYTLVTIEQCGIITTKKDVCPLVEAFTKEENRHIFQNPGAYKSTIEGFMGGKGIHIYRPGMKYPNLSIQYFLDWPKETEVEIMKSGTYEFPIDAGAFQIGPGDSFQEKMFKKIGPYTGFSDNLPDEFSIDLMFGGSIIPTPDYVKALRTKSSRALKERLTMPLEKAFEAGGPGVYYYVVCRSPRLVKSPKQFEEDFLFEGETLKRYEPYFTPNWISKIDEILPLLEENSAKSEYWLKAEINDTIKNYRKLKRVPLIRQASIIQQNPSNTNTRQEAERLAILVGNTNRFIVTRKGRKARRYNRRNTRRGVSRR